MSEISRSALFEKLNKLAYQSVESATVFCKCGVTPTSRWCIGFSRYCSYRIPTCTELSKPSKSTLPFWYATSLRPWIHCPGGDIYK